ncbi:hypothetical protein FRC08_007619 [Ceratobasidium sp. 394]|nr:hypothetical protein FRC08_007619 [Ceratobasidium sp. 394]
MSTESTVQRHAKYYFEDGNVVFLTNDNTLFRLHRSILKRNSVFFNDMFEYSQLPTKNNHGGTIPIDGSSDETPIQLGGPALVTLRDAELELICKALYDMPVTPLTELDMDEAVALLRVSTKFQFEMIHNKAVERLENAPLPPLQRHSLALDCLVDHWFLRAYVDMCSLADHPLASDLLAEFSRRSDPKVFWDLMKLREEYRMRLLIYTYEGNNRPYYASSSATPACSNCLKVMKSLLCRILSTDATSDLAGANRGSLPFLKDRLIQGIQPRHSYSLSICQGCRAQQQAIAAQVLGSSELEGEVKKVVSPALS